MVASNVPQPAKRTELVTLLITDVAVADVQGPLPELQRNRNPTVGGGSL